MKTIEELRAEANFDQVMTQDGVEDLADEAGLARFAAAVSREVLDDPMGPLQIALGVLADIGGSSDMTLPLARAKAARMYKHIRSLQSPPSPEGTA